MSGNGVFRTVYAFQVCLQSEIHERFRELLAQVPNHTGWKFTNISENDNQSPLSSANERPITIIIVVSIMWLSVTTTGLTTLLIWFWSRPKKEMSKKMRQFAKFRLHFVFAGISHSRWQTSTIINLTLIMTMIVFVIFTIGHFVFNSLVFSFFFTCWLSRNIILR